jgi:hypothetical protein
MDITGNAPDNFVLVLLFVSKPLLAPLIHLIVPHISTILACGTLQRMTPMMLEPIKPVLKEARQSSDPSCCNTGSGFVEKFSSPTCN